MTPGAVILVLTLVTAPAAAYLAYRLARELGFLDPAVDKQQEYRRTIVVAVYALLLFVPVLFYGFGKGWPRAWILFGIATGLAFAWTGAAGIRSAVALWRLRHPKEIPKSPE
jgi:hypothetical protein